MVRLFLSILQLLLVIFMIKSPEQAVNNKNVLRGKASYYGKEFQGRKTANGERFSNDDYTAAHRTLPFNSFIRVTNLSNNLSITVRINDRGPYVRSRIIDLTEAAARRIGSYQHGLTTVKIEPLNIIHHNKEIDSLFTCYDVLDCLGNHDELKDFSVSLWSTKDLIHVLYVANELYVNEDIDKVTIVGKGSGENRIYRVVVTGFPTKKAAETAVDYFERKGFATAKLLKD